MPKELPIGWAQTTLGQIAEPSRERVLPAEVPDLPYVGLEQIEPRSMKLIKHEYASEARSSSLRFSTGDVLYAKMRPYLNKVWVAEFDGCCSAEFIVFERRAGLNSEFLGLRLNASDFVMFANGQVSGERPRVDFEKLSSFPILLPPMLEQERIVAKLHLALSGVDRAVTATRRAKERLARYRAAVLQSAVNGELTRKWREVRRNDKDKIEAGEVLLQRLLHARRLQWEAIELERLGHKGSLPKSDHWRSRYVEPEPVDTKALPQLPDTWAWASLDMIATIGSGLSVSRNRPVKDPVELPYLRVANVLRGRLDLSEIKTIRVEKDRVQDYLLRTGDILFNDGGDRDKLGRGWVWEGQIPQCVHQNHVFRVRLIDSTLLNPKLVSNWGNTFGQTFFLTYGTQTTNLASINRNVLSRLPVPIAPVEEQVEILRELTHRLAAADKLATVLDEQLDRSAATRQSLLHDAFMGGLLPQDPGDEPASVLISRIRTARETEAKAPRAKRMSKSESNPERRPLLDILRDHKESMTPELLFRQSGYQQEFEEKECRQEVVDGFYEELRQLVGPQGPVLEKRPDRNTVLLEAKV